MNITEIIALQKRLKVEPDGFWGPKSIAAAQAHLRALMPKKNPWPKSSQADLQAFYGSPGDESKLVNLDVSGLGISYDNRPVKNIRCHRRVSESLERILIALNASPHKAILRRFDGCYANRPMRNGRLPSLHARGAAIDFDAESNGLNTPWPVRATMPFEIMEIFASEGWLPAGAFWHRDAMHFQSSQ